jgi:hypothetical protein
MSRLFAAVVALGLLIPAGAFAQSNDVRSPDARDPFVRPVTKIDLRSPDARIPVTPADTAVKVDLRSPDAVDGATGSRRHVSVPPAIIHVSAPAVDDGGFQWGDAGVGAGILFALLVLPAGGYALMVAHRRSAGGTRLA